MGVAAKDSHFKLSFSRFYASSFNKTYAKVLTCLMLVQALKVKKKDLLLELLQLSTDQDGEAGRLIKLLYLSKDTFLHQLDSKKVADSEITQLTQHTHTQTKKILTLSLKLNIKDNIQISLSKIELAIIPLQCST